MVSVASLPNMMRVSRKRVPCATGPGVRTSQRLMAPILCGALAKSLNTAKTSAQEPGSFRVAFTCMSDLPFRRPDAWDAAQEPAPALRFQFLNQTPLKTAAVGI